MKKLQDNINRKAAKISALSSNKIDKYEYLTGEEVLLPSDQSKIIEEAKFTYSLLCKRFENQNKNNWRTRKKSWSFKSFKNQKLKIKDAILENTLSKEASNEVNKIKEMEKTVNIENVYISKRKIFPIKVEGVAFSYKVSDHSKLKILTPKQMLQR